MAWCKYKWLILRRYFQFEPIFIKKCRKSLSIYFSYQSQVIHRQKKLKTSEYLPSGIYLWLPKMLLPEMIKKWETVILNLFFEDGNKLKIEPSESHLHYFRPSSSSFADKLKSLGRLMDFLWSGVLVLNDFFRTFVRGGRARTSKEMDGTLKIDHDYPCKGGILQKRSRSP